MSLATTVNKVQYTANGSTTVFSFPYKFNTNSDLTVIETNVSTGVDTTKTLTTDYTVSGAGNSGGGSVTFLVAPVNSRRITIQRVVALTQETDYQPDDDFPAEVHEAALDKLTMIAQQLNDADARTLKAPVADSITLGTLPLDAVRANKALVFDATGQVAVSVDNYVDQATAAAASASAASSSASAASTSASNAASSASAASSSASSASSSASAAAASAASVAGGVLDNSVTTIKLVDLAVTTAKIDNLAVTAAKIANSTITAAKTDTTSVAVLGTAQSFTTAHGFSGTTLTDGASISWDLAANQVATVTLAGNRTLTNPTNKVNGNVYILVVKQDGTGGRTLSFGTDYKFAGGTAPTITTTASKADVLTFVCDGTNMLGVASQLFL
jgi:hypothetical protein